MDHVAKGAEYIRAGEVCAMESGAGGDRQFVPAAMASRMEDLSLLITHPHDDVVNMVLDARPSLFPPLRAYVALAKDAMDRWSDEVPRSGLITNYEFELLISHSFLSAPTTLVDILRVPLTGLLFLLEAGFLR